MLRKQLRPVMGVTLATLRAVIYRQDRTTDARMIASGIREDFIRFKGRVSVLETIVPHAKAYKEAATLRIPVRRHEVKRHGVAPSACTVMHELAWELIPSLAYTANQQRAPESRNTCSTSRARDQLRAEHLAVMRAGQVRHEMHGAWLLECGEACA